ncbi:MAG: hypothetical protein KGH57_04055 [Candidatus Micrarchaeota archaeon]|nr:hypothetical protein [Candidatus Micrarchaeota archaeon]
MELDFSFLENQHESQAFMFSVGVVVLSILAVIAFVFSGGSLIFYVLAVVAVALGLYMAYHISKTPAQASGAQRRKQKR